MSRVNELRLIARIAQMYHVEGKRQATIATHLRISQATVSRLLKKAIDESIVRTSVMAPSGTFVELEAKIRDQYRISEVIVVDCSEDREGPILYRIGEAAAHFLEISIQDDEVIGVSSWSETILKMVENIHPLKSGKAKFVVQTLGGMGDPSVQTHATQLTTKLAQLTGAEPRLLNVPGVAPSHEAKLVLVSDPYIRETMDLFRKVTLSIIGIGSIEPSSMLARSGNVFSEKELAALADAGAIGEISLSFFNADGGTVSTPLDDRVIGMPMINLENTDRIIALAGGKLKSEAIRGALRTGIIDVLITDKFTAQRLVGPNDHENTAAA